LVLIYSGFFSKRAFSNEAIAKLVILSTVLNIHNPTPPVLGNFVISHSYTSLPLSGVNDIFMVPGPKVLKSVAL